MTNLEVRIDRLEQQNRILKAVALVLFAIGCLVVFTGQAKRGEEKIITATEIRIVDNEGVLRTRLGYDGIPDVEKTPSLAIYDAKGTFQARYDGNGVFVIGNDGTLSSFNSNAIWIRGKEAEAKIQVKTPTSPSEQRHKAEVLSKLNNISVENALAHIQAFDKEVPNAQISVGQDSKEFRSGVQMFVFDDKASVKLMDKQGKTKSVLGNVSLVDPKTGEVTLRPTSSLIFFGEDDNAITRYP